MVEREPPSHLRRLLHAFGRMNEDLVRRIETNESNNTARNQLYPETSVEQQTKKRKGTEKVLLEERQKSDNDSNNGTNSRRRKSARSFLEKLTPSSTSSAPRSRRRFSRWRSTASAALGASATSSRRVLDDASMAVPWLRRPIPATPTL